MKTWELRLIHAGLVAACCFVIYAVNFAPPCSTFAAPRHCTEQAKACLSK